MVKEGGSVISALKSSVRSGLLVKRSAHLVRLELDLSINGHNAFII